MATSNSERNLTSNRGFYFCCYMLSICGFVVEPSSVSPRNRTIILRKPGEAATSVVKVKTVSDRSAAGFGASIENLGVDYVIVVNIADLSQPVAYILKMDEVRSLINRNEKDGQISYWLEVRDYVGEGVENEWERIQLS